MNELNLADLYQSANILLSADDFSARQTAFESMGKDLEKAQIIDLIRLYFSFGETDTGFEWFRAGIASTDPRFSLVAHRREASVLAGGLLFTSISSGNAFSGNAVLAASIGGKRAPAISGISIDTFETLLNGIAARKQRAHLYATEFTPLGKTSMAKDTLSASASVAALAENVHMASEQSYAASKVSLTELQTVVKQMGEDLSEAREEVEMLWWLIGGWSRSLKRSFVDVGLPLSAVSAGFDLADLSITEHGPFAAKAMLARVLVGIKKRKSGTSLAEVGDSVTPDICNLLSLSTATDQYADICPLSNSLKKSAEIGKGSAWHQSFQRTSHADVTLTLSPTEIASQAMHERLLLNNL